MKTDKELEDLFRDRFKDFEESPPEEAWEIIQPQIRKHKLPGFRIWGVLVIFIFAILIPGVIWKYRPDRNSYTKKESIEKTSTTNSVGFKSSSDYDPDVSSSKSKKENTSHAVKETHKKTSVYENIKDKTVPLSINDDMDKESKRIALSEKTARGQNLTGFIDSDSFRPVKNKPNEGSLALGNHPSKKPGNPLKTNKRHMAVESATRDSIIKSQDSGLSHNISIAGQSPYTPSPLPTLEHHNEIYTFEAVDKEKPQKTYSKEMRGQYLLNRLTPFGIKEKNELSNIDLQFPLNESDFIYKNEIALNLKAILVERSASAKKYNLLVFFSPRYSYRRITLNKGDDIYVQNVSRNKYFGERLGYETGAVLSKKITKRLNLNIGASFINLNEKLTYYSRDGKIDSLKIAQIGPNVFNVSPVYKSDTITFKSVYYYTGLTLSTSYVYATSEKGTFYTTLGGGINLLVRGKTEKMLNGASQSKVYFPSKKSPLEQMNFKVNFGLGYTYKISTKADVVIEPTINYYLGSTYKKREPLGLRPYTIGLNLGLKF